MNAEAACRVVYSLVRTGSFVAMSFMVYSCTFRSRSALQLYGTRTVRMTPTLLAVPVHLHACLMA